MFFSQFVYSWKFSILEYNVTNDGNTSSVLTDNLCDQPHSFATVTFFDTKWRAFIHIKYREDTLAST